MVIPSAKALYVCDKHIGSSDQKTSLVGLFNSIRPDKYPHRQKQFVVFAQLIGGLAEVPFYIDVRFAPSGQLVYSTDVHVLSFPTRTRLVQLVFTIPRCLFREPGRYLIELYCDNQWVADTALELLEIGDDE